MRKIQKLRKPLKKIRQDSDNEFDEDCENDLQIIQQQNVNSLNLQGQWKRLVSQGHLNIFKTNNQLKIKFKNGQNWSFTNKMGEKASIVNLNEQVSKVDFGFPKVTRVIYPGTTARIDTGWQATQLPEGQLMNSVPAKGLIEANVVSIPQVVVDKKVPLVQDVMNNNAFPIQIYMDQQGIQKIAFLNSDTLRQQLTFDIDNLISGVLSTAAHIIPFFI